MSEVGSTLAVFAEKLFSLKIALARWMHSLLPMVIFDEASKT